MEEGTFLIPATFTHTHDPRLPPTTHDPRQLVILTERPEVEDFERQEQNRHHTKFPQINVPKCSKD